MEEEEYYEEPQDIIYDEEDLDSACIAEQHVEQRKPVQAMALDEVSERITMQLRELVDVIAMSEDWALVFLEVCKWNMEKVKTDFFTSNLMERCGYTSEKQYTLLLSGICEVCQLNHESFWSLGCGHLLCTDCCRDYVEFNLTRGDTFFKCMHACCETPFLRQTILTIIDKKAELHERYQMLLRKRFVENSRNLRCCTSSGCNNILQRNDSALKEVECPCKTKFCWDCGERSHHPSTCDQVGHWKVAVIQEPSALWLKRNTSICPKCNILIERIGGCSHMTCAPPRGCGTQFCYVCTEEWKFKHKNPYYCPNYKYKSSTVTIRQRKILELTNINFSAYVENDVKMQKLEKMWQQYKQAQDMLFELLSIDYFETSFIDNYLRSAIDIINTLKWSYALAHYANPHNPSKDIYCYQQKAAQKAGDEVYNLFLIKLRKFLTSIQPLPTPSNMVEDWESEPQPPALDVPRKTQEFFELKEQLLKETKAAQVYRQSLVRTSAAELIS